MCMFPSRICLFSFNPLVPMAYTSIMRLSAVNTTLLPAMFLGDRFYMNRKGGTIGGGWVHQKGCSGYVQL